MPTGIAPMRVSKNLSRTDLAPNVRNGASWKRTLRVPDDGLIPACDVARPSRPTPNGEDLRAFIGQKSPWQISDHRLGASLLSSFIGYGYGALRGDGLGCG